MSQKVPVPAEALRQVAKGATEEVNDYRKRGLKLAARKRERQVSEAYGALNGADGEFVSIDGYTLSGVTAAASYDDVDGRYIHCCRHYLEQYGVW